MTTYYDSKAERTVAAADADTRRARAEATRARAAMQVEAHRAQLQGEHAERVAQARLRAQELRDRRKAERRQASLRRWRERRHGFGRGARQLLSALAACGPMLIGGLAIGAPILISWDGQLQFGVEVMRLGALAIAVPIALEGSAWYLAWLTHQALEKRLPTGQLRLWTWLLALEAAGMNAWHGATSPHFGDDGLQVGLVRGIASLLSVGLWELTVMARRQRASGRSAAHFHAALKRRLLFPRLSWSAARIRAAYGVSCSAEAAWQAAWINRYGSGPEASRRERRISRAIMRRQRKADRQAIKAGQLAMVGGLIVGKPIPIIVPSTPALPTPSIAATNLPSIDTSGNTTIEVSINDGHGTVDGTLDHTIDGAARSPQRHRSIPLPAPASIDRRRPRRSIEPSGRKDGPAPRRSIEEHRERMHAMLAEGRLDRAATTESIRKTLQCAPVVARQLRQELDDVDRSSRSMGVA